MGGNGIFFKVRKNVEKGGKGVGGSGKELVESIKLRKKQGLSLKNDFWFAERK